MQFALIVLAIIAAVSAASAKPAASKVISAVLCLLWLWMGVVYHLMFFTKISPPAYLFAAACVLQGLLLGYKGVVQDRLSFRPGQSLAGVAGAILIVYALIAYPFIGHVLGRTFLRSPTFGTPCPTTIFTFGLLLWTDRKFPPVLLIIPVLWSLVGTSAALKFGIKEDFGLLVAALLTVSLFTWRGFAAEKEDSPF